MKKLISVFLLLNFLNLFFSQQNENPWNFTITTDIADYPASTPIPGPDHYSHVSDLFAAPGIRITGQADYKIPTPLGNHWLLSDANVVLGTNIQLSPVTIQSNNTITFTPFPFLVFTAGASIGTGWNIGNNQGLAEYTASSHAYENITPFASFNYSFWTMGTFQFDTGYVIPGDWTHVVMMAQYEILYTGIHGLSDSGIIIWQTAPGLAGGWQYYSQLILAYQMPLYLYRAGIMFEFTGHFNGSDYGSYNSNFDGKFGTIMISPLIQFKFDNDDTLAFIIQFTNRRSYLESHSTYHEEPVLTKCGSEWIIGMIAASWTHYF